MVRLFYAMLIPTLWRQKKWRPVLIDTGTGCNSRGGDDRVPDLNDKMCYEGRRYYLARPEGKALTCLPEHQLRWGVTCRWGKMEKIAGFDMLKGGEWAGLAREDLPSP